MATKNTHQIKKVSNKSCLEMNVVQISPRAHMSISSTTPASEVGLGARKIDTVEILFCTEMAKYIQFRAQRR